MLTFIVTNAYNYPLRKRSFCVAMGSLSADLLDWLVEEDDSIANTRPFEVPKT